LALEIDWISAALGFIGGAFTGAAGQYIADRFTDSRRTREATREQDRVWRDIERRFPSVIAEMRADFNGLDGRTVRAFFLKPSNTAMGFTSEPAFEYHTDKHPDVIPAVRMLEQRGYVSDVTPGSTPMYRVDESLVDRLTVPPSLLRRLSKSLGVALKGRAVVAQESRSGNEGSY
jgi:hypothetical protein